MKLKTKYPIILLHGTGTRDNNANSHSWGRIPKALKAQGAQVYFGAHDAMGTIENNADMIKSSIEAALAASNSDKINIIALSKGGLDARYAISTLDIADKVASLTTIATPHHGSKAMDFIYFKLRLPLKIVAILVDKLYLTLGDKEPNFLKLCEQITTAHCKEFNKKIRNSEKVYYQSYATIMKKPHSDMLMFFQYLFVRHFEGECDGLVSLQSAKWDNFKGVFVSRSTRGISHSDIRDMRKKPSKGLDSVKICMKIVKDLIDMGL